MFHNQRFPHTLRTTYGRPLHLLHASDSHFTSLCMCVKFCGSERKAKKKFVSMIEGVRVYVFVFVRESVYVCQPQIPSPFLDAMRSISISGLFPR